MFKRTLLVLEPGCHADAVIQTGLALARSCLAEVVFYTRLSRTRLPVADLPDPVMAAQWDSLDDERLLTDRLHARARQMADGLGVLSRSVIVTASEPVRSIVDAAQASYCDVIVAASERSNAVVRLLNGSFIPGLVTASPVPFMVCSPRPSQGLARGTDIGRILVILEDSDTTGAARTQGLDLARELGADLLFAHVMPPARYGARDRCGGAGFEYGRPARRRDPDPIATSSGVSLQACSKGGSDRARQDPSSWDDGQGHREHGG